MRSRRLRLRFCYWTEISCTGLLAGGGARGSGKPRKIMIRKIGSKQKKSGVFQLSLRFIMPDKW